MRFTRLDDWLQWQTTLHTKNIDLGLERAAKVWQRLHPQALSSFVISIAGTNGKGSSVAMLEAVLLAAGYKVGAYTSPHLIHYNERIRITGEAVDDASICAAFAAIDEAREDTSLSYFEFGTLAALYLFAEAGLDVMLLEVGLGGRLDAVNIIEAKVALLTTIGLDHQDWLGSDRETIGFEKAGIMRAGRPAVFSGAEIPQSVIRHAREIGADLKIAGRDFGFVEQQNAWDFFFQQNWRYALPYPLMRGRYQLDNASGVLAVLEMAKSLLPVDNQAIRQGLQSAVLPGRFQIIQAELPVIIDVAHNQQAIDVLRQNLQQFRHSGKTHLIVGMLKDKDIVNSLVLLKQDIDVWYLVSTPGDRGLAVSELANYVAKFIDPARVHQQHESVGSAYAAVLQCAGEHDICVVTGSFLVAGEMLSMLQDKC